MKIMKTCPECGIKRLSGWKIDQPISICRKCNGKFYGREGAKDRIKHGDSGTKLYLVWRGIKNRCNLESDPNYKFYGEKGITVCNEWNDSYEVFKNWSMCNGYKDGLWIERKDNSKGYSPDNCIWEVSIINRRHQTHFKLDMNKASYIRTLVKMGFDKSDISWAYGVSSKTVNNVLKGKIWAVAPI